MKKLNQFKQNKLNSVIPFFFVLIIIPLALFKGSDGTTKTETPIKNEVKVASTNDKQPSNVLPVGTESIEPIDDFVYRIEFQVDENLQRFIHDKAASYDIPETLVYAIIKTESSFDKNAVSFDHSSLGIMQINKNTGKWIASELGYENYDLFDAKTNVEFGLWYLDYLRSYWNKYDLSDEQVYDLLIISYNRGENGAKTYVKRHGYNNDYLNKVSKYKEEFEKGIE